MAPCDKEKDMVWIGEKKGTMTRTQSEDGTLAYTFVERPECYSKWERRVEAFSWLDENRNPAPFASNRFKSAEEARAFMANLRTLGATAVYVSGVMDEKSRIEMEGGPYADALVVLLPKDRNARAALFKVAEEVAKEQGFEPEADRGQSELFLWWD